MLGMELTPSNMGMLVKQVFIWPHPPRTELLKDGSCEGETSSGYIIRNSKNWVILPWNETLLPLTRDSECGLKISNSSNSSSRFVPRLLFLSENDCIPFLGGRYKLCKTLWSFYVKLIVMLVPWISDMKTVKTNKQDMPNWITILLLGHLQSCKVAVKN